VAQVQTYHNFYIDFKYQDKTESAPSSSESIYRSVCKVYTQ